MTGIRPDASPEGYVKVRRLVTASAVIVTVITACSGGSSSTGERVEAGGDLARPAPLDSTLVQDLLPDSAAEALPHLPSRMPRSASFPPARSTPLLDDLPGRAVVVMSESDSTVDRYYAYRDFEDVEVYFLGVDRRWRSLNLGDLGIDPGDFTSDVVLRLSPDGRYCLFRTFTRAAVLDLTTGRLRLIKPERPQIERPEWLPNGTFVLGSWTATDPRARWALVDPRSGRQRVWDGPRLDLLSFKTDGTPVRIDRGPRKTRRLVELGEDGEPARSTAIPFGFRGRVWAEFSTAASPSISGSSTSRIDWRDAAPSWSLTPPRPRKPFCHAARSGC